MFVIPFGEECLTSMIIDSKFKILSIREVALPFDYVGHSFLKNIIKLISNKKYVLDKNCFILQKKPEHIDDNKYYFVDKNYGFCYWHEKSYLHNNINNTDLTNIITKFNKRYQRLFQILNSDEQKIILSINHYSKQYNNEFSKDFIISQKKELDKYLKNYKFITINYSKETFIHDNLYHYYIISPIKHDIKESKKIYKHNIIKELPEIIKYHLTSFLN